MTNLDPVADKAVRNAVDAFMEGRLTPELPGETVFETKNSRYRLLDGIVFAAPDEALIGSELVGWLMESRRHSVVESAWQPGSRAVLVDRHRGRNITVTSTTRLLHLEEHASIPPPPKPPPPKPPAREGAAAVQKRAAAIHLPPRPIARPAPAASPTPSPDAARSLPTPAPPPHRNASSPTQVNTQRPPADDTAWELTSSEFEPEPASDAPIPLVRAHPQSGHGAPRPRR